MRRQLAKPRVGVHALEDLVAGELGHHDVEQNEVELFFLEHLERFASVVRSRDFAVALAFQALRQRVAVILVVIDDQQPRIGRRHRSYSACGLRAISD